jgi:type II secretory pathway pseudopilin PulG
MIELLIVVAIILIISVIAIPNLVRARIASNESSAAASSTYPTVGYAAQIQDLGRQAPACNPAPTHACLLDDSLANAVPGSTGHTGYQFLATGINSGGAINGDFVVGGTPIGVGTTGTRDFCSVTDGTLRARPVAGGVPPSTLANCLAFPVAQ